jgi:hypothetical protein
VSNLMEWIVIFFMFYIFASIWLISTMLEKILKILEEMNSDK